MDCKVDYINFSVPTRVPFELGDLENHDNAHMVLRDFLGSCYAPIFGGHVWEFNESKGFYHTRWYDTDTKISVFVGTVNKHIHLEVGGQALDFIRAVGCYEDFMKIVAPRTSRCDFAVDFETQDTVSSFIDNNYKGRFKAGGHVFSEDGETRYVGSWKGERFARVYRYHPPHPRSNKLRAEVVLRGNYAKQGMAIWCEEGEVAATLAAHEPFQWSSPLWQPEIATESRIKSQRSDKEKANTLRWMNGDVAACLANLHNEGFLNADNWFNEFVVPRLARHRQLERAIVAAFNSSGKSDEVSR